MSKVNYPAVFHSEKKSYWVEFPDLEGCLTDGPTLEKAYENAKEALSMYIDKNGDRYEEKNILCYICVFICFNWLWEKRRNAKNKC